MLTALVHGPTITPIIMIFLKPNMNIIVDLVLGECDNCRLMRRALELEKSPQKRPQKRPQCSGEENDPANPSNSCKNCRAKHPLQPMHQPIYPQAEKPIETPLLVREQSSEHNTFFGIFGFISAAISLVLVISVHVNILCALALLMAIVILAACATQAIMLNATPSARSLTFQQ